jgi:hypothetical protein
MNSAKAKGILMIVLGFVILGVYFGVYVSYRNKTFVDPSASELVIYNESGDEGLFNLFFKPAMFFDELITGKKIIVQKEPSTY